MRGVSQPSVSRHRLVIDPHLQKTSKGGSNDVHWKGPEGGPPKRSHYRKRGDHTQSSPHSSCSADCTAGGSHDFGARMESLFPVGSGAHISEIRERHIMEVTEGS